MSEVRTLLLRTAGTNCDRELAHAFTLAGASTHTLHLNQLLQDPSVLGEYQILAFPGGFSYGDDIASGKIFANQLIHHLGRPLKQFVADGKMILGVCNGFQILIKSGLLPGSIPQLDAADTHPATLTHNTSGTFIDRWVRIRSTSSLNKWMPKDRTIMIPIAHGEGRFVTRDAAVLEALKANDQIAFRYVDESDQPTMVTPLNPNGSVEAVAGITDITGRVLGLMPHPERISDALNHPLYARDPSAARAEGQLMFETAVGYIRERQTVAV